MDKVLKLFSDKGYEIKHQSGFAEPNSYECKKNPISIWIRNNIISAVFFKNGSYNVSEPFENKKINSNLIDEIWNLKDSEICSKCGTKIIDNNLGGSHFAGIYCKKCWELYKKDNNGSCSKCGKPYYVCHC